MENTNTKKFLTIHEGSENSVWKFPKHIDFEKSTNYLYRTCDIDFSANVIFDLTETENVHSSFIGFMIELRTKFENRGGTLIVNLSPDLERLFSRMSIYEHFQPEPVHKAV